MNLVFLVKLVQIIVSVIVVVLILIQGKGGGLSSTFGGSFAVYRSRRGVEKVVMILTIFFSIILIINSLILINLS